MDFNVRLTEAHLFPTGTEDACAAMLFQWKWPDGYCCPRCAHPHCYVTTTRRLPLFECRLCRHQASLLTGSVFEGSKTDLTKWFTALALVASDLGTSALRLSRIICVTYKTAWTMLQKIRYAIGSADMENLLLGIVQVNAAVYNRPLNALFQASPTEHPFFVGAGSSTTAPDGTDYVKMKLISKKHIQNRIVHRDAIKAFIQNEISSAATAVTYVTQRYSSARLVPLLQLAGRASRWMNRTFKGLGRKHLQVYLDEFCYRINHSNNGSSVISSLTHLCMRTPRYTYRQLISFCS